MRSPSSCRTASGACIRSSEDLFYYITLYNENYPQPPCPKGATEGILKGIYKFKARTVEAKPRRGATFRQRSDADGSGEGARHSGREVRRRSRRMERHQLQRTAPRSFARSIAGTACIRRGAEEAVYSCRR